MQYAKQMCIEPTLQCYGAERRRVARKLKSNSSQQYFFANCFTVLVCLQDVSDVLLQKVASAAVVLVLVQRGRSRLP